MIPLPVDLIECPAALSSTPPEILRKSISPLVLWNEMLPLFVNPDETSRETPKVAVSSDFNTIDEPELETIAPLTLEIEPSPTTNKLPVRLSAVLIVDPSSSKIAPEAIVTTAEPV